jgi:predicted N-acetyltransferase YhbS
VSDHRLYLCRVWNIETLAGHEGRDVFDCGDEDMNRWLSTQAKQSGRSGNTLTRVLLHPEDARIVGYYATQAYRLEGDALAGAFGAGAQKYSMPAVLIARLARCLSVKGEGVGGLLMAHALRACLRVSENTGVELAVVHAIDADAAAFYSKFNFEPFLEHPLHMMLPVKEIRKAFG